ncbi:hypothetical protein PSECIP111854_03922 [Pseudoalteromonas sp. CIP111854]|uniref:Uncharacterized protein n=2 Tax=Pseudoalteromonas holothuriae TaxID=2963714 RepID=A0A9W4R4B7_9GAMM|nr:hypothetical protein [Pseudoalteromonas sp. CIP111854]CAH9066599.1 hypothetical protein PSECIP111854_03922 [Pseudoalteromonas sp. CIP111854]
MIYLTSFSSNIPRCSQLIIVAMSSMLIACQQTPIIIGQSEKLYDFDHKVHYEQTKYNNDHYLLKIKSDNYEHFLQQSVFLLRHSIKLCQGQAPQLTLLKGVQRFEKLPTTPRPFQSDLGVDVKCVD